MQHRPDRVAHELKNEISVIIARELHDPRVGLATVTDAKVSPDLRHARVFVSVYGPPEEQQETLAALNHAAGFIRRAIGARMRLRRSPEIVFTFDESVEYGDRMERLIEEVNQESPGCSTSDQRPDQKPGQKPDQRFDDEQVPEV